MGDLDPGRNTLTLRCGNGPTLEVTNRIISGKDAAHPVVDPKFMYVPKTTKSECEVVLTLSVYGSGRDGMLTLFHHRHAPALLPNSFYSVHPPKGKKWGDVV